MTIVKCLCSENYLLDAIITLGEGFSSETTSSVLQCFQNHEERHLVQLLGRCLFKEASKKVAPEVLFRENTLAIDLLVKFILAHSREYFREALGSCLNSIVLNPAFQNVEINPAKLDKNTKANVVQERYKVLREAAENIVDALLKSVSRLPSVVRYCLSTMQQVLQEYSREASLKLAGSFFFLRIFNPILISPESANIVQDFAPECRRGLILLSKILQSTANEVPFDGAKEAYMTPLNDFVTQNTSRLLEYYAALTNPMDDGWLESHILDWKMPKDEVSSENAQQKLRQFLLQNFVPIMNNIPLKHLQGRQQKIQELQDLVLPSAVAEWDVEEVCLWLELHAELPMYKTLFREQRISGVVLEDLSFDDLTNMGISSLGHKKKLIRLAQQLKDKTDFSPLMRRCSTTDLKAGAKLQAVSHLRTL